MPVTWHGPASSTVTRSTRPSSRKRCVIPSFLARIAATVIPTSAGQADLDVHSGRQVVETLERVDRLWRRLVDVDEPFVGADLEVLAGVLVLERRADHAVHVLLRGQGNRARHGGAGARGGLHDLLGRRLDGRVVVGLEPDPDLVLGDCCQRVAFWRDEGESLSCGDPPLWSYLSLFRVDGRMAAGDYSTTSVTTPEPTVRPP